MTRPAAAPRGRVVVMGTAHYDHLDDDGLTAAELPRVPQDLRLVRQAFQRLGYEPGPDLLDLSRNDLVDRLDTFLREEADYQDSVAARDVPLVLYYSGHGVLTSRNRHCLMLRDTRPDALRRSGLAPEELAELAVEAGVERLLLIIDTCFAGHGGSQSVREMARLMQSRLAEADPTEGREVRSFSVLTAAAAGQEAADGAFATALAEVFERRHLGGDRPESFDLKDIVGWINGRLGPHQRASYATVEDDGFSFFPNPRHLPRLPPRADLAEAAQMRIDTARQRRERELVSHFRPRGLAVDELASATSHFVGREAALSALLGHLSGDGPSRPLVVTGGAGVGKSSLLSRAVLLSRGEAEWPGEVLRVHVAVHLRGLAVGDVVRGVAAELGLDTADPAELRAGLAERTEPLVAVLDALDEAGGAAAPNEPLRIISQVLHPLSDVPCVRLAVGTRPPLLDALGPGFARLDLDKARWTRHEDLVDFTRRLLVAPDGPGSHSPYTDEATSPVAEAIAVRAAGNFLSAKMRARELGSRATVLDTGRPGWQDDIPGDRYQPGADLFRHVLRERLGPAEPRARTLLTALAFAEGNGLPAARVWPAVASALGEPVTDADVQWALEAAGAYVVEDLDPYGRSVYRLYHQSFAEELRPAQGADRMQRRITEALLSLLPEPRKLDTWLEADPYLLLHLATHAAEGGLMDFLAGEAGFLLLAEVGSVREALTTVTSEQGMAARSAYESCAMAMDLNPYIDGRSLQLQIAAREAGADELFDNLTGLTDDWQGELVWSLRSQVPHRAVGSFTLGLLPDQVALLEVDGKVRAVTYDQADGLRSWDCLTGACDELDVGISLSLGEEVHGIMPALPQPSPWLLVHWGVGSGWESRAAVWDVRTGLRIGPEVTGEIARVAVVEVGERCVGALLRSDGSVALHDMCSGEEMLRTPPAPDIVGWSRSFAEHKLLFAAGRRDGRIVVAIRCIPVGLSAWPEDPPGPLVREHVFDLDTMRVPITRTWRLSGSEVYDLVVSDGLVLVTTDEAGRRVQGPLAELGFAQEGLGRIVGWCTAGARILPVHADPDGTALSVREVDGEALHRVAAHDDTSVLGMVPSTGEPVLLTRPFGNAPLSVWTAPPGRDATDERPPLPPPLGQWAWAPMGLHRDTAHVAYLTAPDGERIVSVDVRTGRADIVPVRANFVGVTAAGADWPGPAVFASDVDRSLVVPCGTEETPVPLEDPGGGGHVQSLASCGTHRGVRYVGVIGEGRRSVRAEESRRMAAWGPDGALRGIWPLPGSTRFAHDNLALCYDGNLFLVTDTPDFEAIDVYSVPDGNRLRRFTDSMGHDEHALGLWGDRAVLALQEGPRLCVRDVTTGEQLWSYDVVERWQFLRVGSLLEADTVLGGSGHELVAFNRAIDAPVLYLALGSTVLDAHVLPDGHVAVLTATGLVCVRLF
ncbi:caspase family protein [Streptomyces mutabilis]|uniref:caspase family protein n=1 Tax=Streptomyces mutabilis TaxID=67332 RepID=UPI0034DE0A1D